MDREQRKQEVDEGSDGQRVDQGADADRAAQQPSGGQDADLDGGAGAADGEATCGEPGHQAVAGTRSQPGPDVQAGGDGIDEDRGEQRGPAHREVAGAGQDGQRGIGGQTHEDDVGDGAVARALAQREPGGQHEEPDAVDHPTQGQPGATGQPLMEHIPGVQPEPRSDQQRDAQAEKEQAGVELNETSW